MHNVITQNAVKGGDPYRIDTPLMIFMASNMAWNSSA